MGILGIFLGAHGSLAQDANQLTQPESLSGWKLLFDGKTTTGWRNYKQDGISSGWKVIDGALVRSEKGAGDIITKDKYKAFELSLEYKISQGGNSGVMFHVVEGDGPPWNTGPEIQVQDNQGGRDPQKAGWLYQLYEPIVPGNDTKRDWMDATRPVDQWNQLFIRIAPSQCEVSMNGVLYYRFKIGDRRWNEQVAKSKFAKFEGFGKAGEGHICLQDHGDLVSYRNVKIRELTEGSLPQPIHGKLSLKGELAFPKIHWDQWDPLTESGNLQKLRFIELTYPKDRPERLFAVSQAGEIFSFENRNDVKESKLFLDLTKKVNPFTGQGANEQGLLGLAFHPQFKSNGVFFVNYTRNGDDRTIVSRFRVSKDDPLKADPGSEEVILDVEQPFKNHNGGSIEFGPDGFLYIAFGDGGLRNDPKATGQDLSQLLGKILRIDVDITSDGRNYGIPTDNPFRETPGARPEIFAYGFRNPWRIAFDKQTKLLWMGDVGQELWEEVNVVKKGGNYGWSHREGAHAFGNRPNENPSIQTLDPLWEYDHSVGKSITGGRVYNGSRLPDLKGKYLYADYVTGSVWALTYNSATGKADRNELVIPNSIPILAFGEDAAGEVYFLIESSKGECIYRFAKD
jgi:glucose/arabinose dehydrogenase